MSYKLITTHVITATFNWHLQKVHKILLTLHFCLFVPPTAARNLAEKRLRMQPGEISVEKEAFSQEILTLPGISERPPTGNFLLPQRGLVTLHLCNLHLRIIQQLRLKPSNNPTMRLSLLAISRDISTSFLRSIFYLRESVWWYIVARQLPPHLVTFSAYRVTRSAQFLALWHHTCTFPALCLQSTGVLVPKFPLQLVTTFIRFTPHLVTPRSLPTHSAGVCGSITPSPSGHSFLRLPVPFSGGELGSVNPQSRSSPASPVSRSSSWDRSKLRLSSRRNHLRVQKVRVHTRLHLQGRRVREKSLRARARLAHTYATFQTRSKAILRP